MLDKKSIREFLISKLSTLRSNTSVFENSDSLILKEVQEGIILIYSSWSESGITNCIRTIQLLYEKNYSGRIIILDNDCLSPELQIKIFGQVFHGWGEIFVIKKGIILEKYLNKES